MKLLAGSRPLEAGEAFKQAERRAFIYVMVPYGSASDFRSLMRGLTLVAEMRANRDMEPISVEGSLEPMSDIIKNMSV